LKTYEEEHIKTHMFSRCGNCLVVAFDEHGGYCTECGFSTHDVEYTDFKYLDDLVELNNFF